MIIRVHKQCLRSGVPTMIPEYLDFICSFVTLMISINDVVHLCGLFSFDTFVTYEPFCHCSLQQFIFFLMTLTLHDASLLFFLMALTSWPLLWVIFACLYLNNSVGHSCGTLLNGCLLLTKCFHVILYTVSQNLYLRYSISCYSQLFLFFPIIIAVGSLTYCLLCLSCISWGIIGLPFYFCYLMTFPFN